MEINTIQLLIHPGYHQLPLKPNQKIQKTKEREFLLKQTFNTLGQIILNSKTKQGTIVIFVPAQETTKSKELINQQERFSKWAQEQLGKRFITLPTNFGIGFKTDIKNIQEQFKPVKPAIKKLKGTKFQKVVKIIANGEYKNQCVTTAKERLAVALHGLGVKQIIKTNGVVLSYEKAQKTHAELIYRKKYAGFVKWRRETFGKTKITGGIKPNSNNKKTLK